MPSDDTPKQVAAPASEADAASMLEINGIAELRLALIYRVIVWLGLALLAVGTAMQVIVDGKLTPALVGLAELPGALLSLQSDAAITLGLLVFIAGPAIGLASLVLSYTKRRERLALVVVLVVLAIILLSIPLQYLVEGS